jgi:hypothetical protein
MSLAYTSFNSFLPILLEQRVDPTSSKGGRVEALQEVVFFAIAGCPGALVRPPFLYPFYMILLSLM